VGLISSAHTICEACTSTPPFVARSALAPNQLCSHARRYELVAIQLISGLMDPAAHGRFLAVQWRSEDWQKQLKSSAGTPTDAAHALRPCAEWAAERVLAIMAQHNLSEAYLATDLRGGASGT
jgi:hypothetical protein